jgi:hypothetical protein
MLTVSRSNFSHCGEGVEKVYSGRVASSLREVLSVSPERYPCVSDTLEALASSDNDAEELFFPKLPIKLRKK